MTLFSQSNKQLAPLLYDKHFEITETDKRENCENRQNSKQYFTNLSIHLLQIVYYNKAKIALPNTSLQSCCNMVRCNG